MNRNFISWCFLFFTSVLFSQENWTKEQLLKKLNETISDTTRIDIYNELTWPVYSYDLPDSSIYYGQKSLALSRKAGDLLRLSVAYRRLGITYSNIGDIKKSISNQEESYRIAKDLHFERGMYLALNNIGVAYLNNESLNNAIAYFLNALKHLENTEDYATLARLHMNCGTIYKRLNNPIQARLSYLKSLYYARLIEDKPLQIDASCHLSSVHRALNSMDSAWIYLAQAKKVMNENIPQQNQFTFYLTEALLYDVTGDHKKALQCLLNTSRFQSGYSDEITLFINIGEQYNHLGDESNALKYFYQAFQKSKDKLMYDNLQYTTFRIATIQEKRKNLDEYVRMIKLYLVYRDSNERINKAQEILAKQLEFDYERKHVADSVRFEQREKFTNMQLEVSAARLSNAKTLRIVLIIIVVFLLIGGLFIAQRLKVTRRQKQIIEEQKQIVDLKNREIVDSINYTKRLQEAILPQLADIKKHLNLDILYLPKDIIGGDFYFFDSYRNHIFFAVCDCTGHGVPGAMMSIVCHNALKKSIREFNLNDPALILKKSREIITESLNAVQQNIRDGMDCTLLVIDMSNNSAKWCGAHNPLWKFSGDLMTEIKANKHSVSFYENPIEFVSHQFDFAAGDLIYLFTDGFADQFGGPSGKKYKYKTLKAHLLSIISQEPVQQIKSLNAEFYKWKGALDQVDDVTVAVLKM